MTPEVASSPKVKWNISVPREFDEATRVFLASHGGKKVALSALVQKAVSGYIIAALAAEMKENVRKSGMSQEDLEQFIADGIWWSKEQQKLR